MDARNWETKRGYYEKNGWKYGAPSREAEAGYEPDPEMWNGHDEAWDNRCVLARFDARETCIYALLVQISREITRQTRSGDGLRQRTTVLILRSKTSQPTSSYITASAATIRRVGMAGARRA